MPAAGHDTYTVRVHSSTGNDFEISRLVDGSTTLTCTTSGKAGCPSNGIWGGG